MARVNPALIRGRIRFSRFTLIMLGLIAVAIIVLAPSLRMFAEQRQQIAGLQAEIASKQAETDALHSERERWNDPNFIAAKARERLYYVSPGEVSYLVINDLPAGALGPGAQPISNRVEAVRGDWTRTLVSAVMTAGLAPVGSGASQ